MPAAPAAVPARNVRRFMAPPGVLWRTHRPEVNGRLCAYTKREGNHPTDGALFAWPGSPIALAALDNCGLERKCSAHERERVRLVSGAGQRGPRERTSRESEGQSPSV